MDRIPTWGWIGAAVAALALLYWFLVTPVSAADLGGGCCADLEERIAELEATTAKKGNRKVSVTVTGQVNGGLLWVDAGDYSNTTVQQSGVDESFIAFRGEAKINPDVVAGYIVEFTFDQLGLQSSQGKLESNGVTVRQSAWYLASKNLGKVTVGKTGVATNDLDKINTAKIDAAWKPFILGTVSHAYLSGIDLPFDGGYRDVVRYDSPSLNGLTLAASWGSSISNTDPDGDGDMWDVALRYAGEFSGFKVAGGLGYRADTDLEINLLNLVSLALPTGDVKTGTAVGSIMHTGSGLFLTGNYTHQDWDAMGGFVLKGWQATGGLETRLSELGKTTFYAEYGVLTFDPSGVGSADVNLWGGGIVQSIDAAAMDLYVSYRNYDLGELGSDEDIQAATVGARIKF